MHSNWKIITKERLAELVKENSNSMIANQYGVSVGQVRYKRKKFGITMYDLAFQEVFGKRTRQKIKDSVADKDLLFNSANIDMLAKAITQYAFRSGPVEQMHCESKLTDEDMKILNKDMVNKIAGLLQKVFDDEWEQIMDVFSFYVELCSNWDNAEPDTKDFDINF